MESSPSPPPRTATLVLVDAAGRVLGALAPIAAATPWWVEAEPVVEAVWRRDGLRVTVLRLLAAERAAPPGGAVTYLAQLDADADAPPSAALQPWHGTLTEDPLRHPYAAVGGPAADLAWAGAQLRAQGILLQGRPRQMRTWNLSSLWCLPTDGGAVWLKCVPPFFAHEARLIAALAAAQPDAPVPRLLAADGGRMLLAHLPGDDLYGARGALCHAMIDLLVALQAAWQGQGEALRAMGLPDWRGPAMAAALAALVARRGGEFGADERARLDRFVAGLPARFAAIAACGLADGLVHGDFHAGNLRGDPGPHSSGGGRLTLLDWGDSGIGHPLLDQSAFLSRIAPEDVAAARAHWTAAWRRLRPGAQVERAAALLAPVASARMALIYQRFLDGIEAAEHPYHRADVPAWLGRTLQALAAEGGA